MKHFYTFIISFIIKYFTYVSQISFSLDMSLCGCFILEKGIIFSKSVRGTSKKLKNTQCFRFAICYCGIFRKSGMSDMWYFRSDDKVPRQSPIDLQKQNFRIFFPLNFTKEGRFFHVGIFNGLRTFFLANHNTSTTLCQ